MNVRDALRRKENDARLPGCALASERLSRACPAPENVGQTFPRSPGMDRARLACVLETRPQQAGEASGTDHRPFRNSNRHGET
jgi:hypothetical protein